MNIICMHLPFSNRAVLYHVSYFNQWRNALDRRELWRFLQPHHSPLASTAAKISGKQQP